MKTLTECLNEGVIPFVPLQDILNKINLDTLINKTLNLAAWADGINRRVKIPEVKVVYQTSSHLDSGDMTVSGEYDDEAHDEGKKKYITITLVFSDKDTELTMGKEGLYRLKNGIAHTIQHELHHAQQYSGRDFVVQRKFTKFTSKIEDVMASQKYLGNSDEISAFALNIAHELVVSYGGKEEALKAIRNPSKIPMSHSMNLFVYSVAFNLDWTSVVLKKLLKTIVAYLERI
jgi:hypothetical protein